MAADIDNPILRAATALWEIGGRPMRAHDLVATMSIPEGEPDIERFVPQARAVLTAIREPSETMRKAGGDVADDGAATVGSGHMAGAMFTAMIDAALAEEG